MYNPSFRDRIFVTAISAAPFHRAVRRHAPVAPLPLGRPPGWQDTAGNLVDVVADGVDFSAQRFHLIVLPCRRMMSLDPANQISTLAEVAGFGVSYG